MGAFRYLLAQRLLAALICAAALLMKVAVPGGYMVSTVAGWPTITLCPQVASTPMTMTASVHGDRADAEHDHHDKTGESGKAELPCVFTALSAATLAATDLILLAALIAFVMRLAIGGVVLPRLTEPARMRPPLRGPPILL